KKASRMTSKVHQSPSTSSAWATEQFSSLKRCRTAKVVASRDQIVNPWGMSSSNWKASACILCECNCGLEVELGGEGGRHLVRLRGDKRHPASRGYACEKAHRLDHYQHGRDRLTTPLRRRTDGTFEAIDWDTAIREVAARLAAVRNTYGGDTIFY